MLRRPSRLVRSGDCVFDREQLIHSFGYESLDAVGREAFVNHIHLEGENRERLANELVSDWSDELREKWPLERFRIYWCEDVSEITVRFHRVRDGVPNWYDSGLSNVRVIDVGE
jgi:hypothetical protein